MQGGGGGSPAIDSCDFLFSVIDLQKFDLKCQRSHLLELLNWLVQFEKEDFLQLHLNRPKDTCAPALRGKERVRKHSSSNSVRLSLRLCSFSMRLTGVAGMRSGRELAARESLSAKRPEV